MGLTLVMLGAILFVSQWKGIQAFDAFIVWWPLILILLGMEIIVYLFISRKENPVIYYDIFSIFFVAVLCAGCFGFTFLTSVGVVQEVRSMMHTIDQTLDLPEVKAEVPQEIKRIVVLTSGEQVKIDKGTQPSLYVFGTYRTQSQSFGEENTVPLKPDSYCTVRSAGDTMYVQFKSPPVERGLRSGYRYMAVTAVLPQDKQVEVRGYNNQVINS
jgi:hypothetical protein